MVSPLVNSMLMEKDYNIFKITVLTMQGVFLIAFVAMYFVGKRLPSGSRDYKQGTPEETS